MSSLRLVRGDCREILARSRRRPPASTTTETAPPSAIVVSSKRWRIVGPVINASGGIWWSRGRRQWEAVDATLRGIWQALHPTGPVSPAASIALLQGICEMAVKGGAAMLDDQIGEWRSYLNRRQAIHSVDVAELEDHLREQIAVLTDAGL